MPILNTQMSSTVIDGRLFLYDRQRDTSHALNASATLVWASVDDRTRTVDLIEQLAHETGKPAEAIDADVRAVLAQFLSTTIVLSEPAVDLAHDPATPMLDTAEPAPRSSTRATRGRVARVLDPYEWCPGIGARQAGGVAVLVRTKDPTLQRHMDDRLISLPGAPEAEATISIVDRGRDGARRYRVFCDDELRQRVASPERAAACAFSELNQLAISRTTGRLRFHGGAVERNGMVVAVLGASGRGKSTLTAALMQRGWAYLTDEMVAVDPATLRVDPYPKVLDLSEHSLQLLGASTIPTPIPWGKSQVLPTTLGSVSTGGRLGLLVILTESDEDGAVTEDDGVDDRGQWLVPIESLEQLLPNTFNETMSMTSALDQLAHLCNSVRATVLARTDLEWSCAAIERWADSVGQGLVDDGN